jgi:lysozyme family protein
MDKEKVRFIILDLEVDGLDHDGAAIDAHVASVLGVSEQELAAIHAKTNRGVFLNHVDFVKAHLTGNKLHEKVGESNGQCVYRITPKGRDVLAQNKRIQELQKLAYGKGTKAPM